MEIISTPVKRFTTTMLLTFSALLFVIDSNGQNSYDSNPGGGDWSNPLTWTHTGGPTPGPFPGPGDIARIIPASTVTYDIPLFVDPGVALGGLEILNSGSLIGSSDPTTGILDPWPFHISANGDLVVIEGNIELFAMSIGSGGGTGIVGIDENSSLDVITILEFFGPPGPVFIEGSITTLNFYSTDRIFEIKGTIDVLGNLDLIGTTLNINGTGTLEVSGVSTMDAGSLIDIKPVLGQTGSFILDGSLAGDILTQNVVPNGPWQIISPPLSGMTVEDFLNHPDHSIAIQNNKYGLAKYNEGTDSWVYYPDTHSGTEELVPGTAYSLHYTTAGGLINYEGTGATGSAVPVSITKAGNGWNGIGNPYTSAISISEFLTDNASQLSATLSGVYLWEINNWVSYSSASPNLLPPGQGFFVNSRNATGTATFNTDIKSHGNATAIKSTPNNTYNTVLMASSGDVQKKTSLYFLQDMTEGLDITYDVGLRKVNTNFELYTKLLLGYPDVDFEHQALPDYDLDQLVIPIGLDCAEGGKVVFSASEINLPAGAQAILEDKETGTFTDLTGGAEYTADIAAGTYGEGRFYINMKSGNGSTGIELEELLSVKAFYNTFDEIQIEGQLGSKATASLFDMTGKKVGDYLLKAENINMISVTKLEKGIYLLRVRDGEKIFKTSIPIF